MNYLGKILFWGTVFTVGFLSAAAVWANDNFSAAEKARIGELKSSDFTQLAQAIVILWIVCVSIAIIAALGETPIRKHGFLLTMFVASIVNMLVCFAVGTHIQGFIWGMGAGTLAFVISKIVEFRKLAKASR